MFGACGAGFRRDCIRPVCLARHIDDPPPNISCNSKGRVPFMNNRTITRKKYDTRREKKKRQENPLSMKKRGLNIAQEDDEIQNESTKIDKPIQNDQDEVSILIEEMDDTTEILKERVNYRLNSLEPVYGSKNYYKTGLHNIGNSCYMNSVIQCLVHPYFTSVSLTHPYFTSAFLSSFLVAPACPAIYT